MLHCTALLVLIGWILWLSTVCDRARDVTPNWRRWTHIQWAAGAAFVLASPSWPFTLLYLSLCAAYWLPWVEAKSGALNDWFIKVFLFGGFYVAAMPRMEAWMLPWLLLFVLICGSSVAFWIAMVKWRGPRYALRILGWEYPCWEMWPDRDEPTPGGFNCHGRMMNPVHAGAWGSICVFASLGLGAMWHPAWTATAAIGAFILWGSGSRGGALNMAAGGLAWALAGGPYADWVWLGVFLCAALASYRKVRDWSWAGNLSSWRFQVWWDSVRLCLGNPFRAWESAMFWLIGTGPFGWQDIAEKHLRKYGERSWLSPHNEYVHILCEHGLLGLAASVIFIGWTLEPAWRSGSEAGAAYLGVAGALLATAAWSFPWRGTALIEGATGRFMDTGAIRTADGKEKKVLVPEIQYGSAGAPIFTWLTAVWAVLGPHMG